MGVGYVSRRRPILAMALALLALLAQTALTSTAAPASTYGSPPGVPTVLTLPVDPSMPPVLIPKAVVPRDMWDVPRSLAWDHPPNQPGIELTPLTMPPVIGSTPSNPNAPDLPLLSLGDAVLGTLKGGGAFAYYRFNFEVWLDFNNGPNAEQVWLWFDPSDVGTAGKVGFNVFDNSGTVVARGQAMDHDAVIQGGQLVPRGSMKNVFYRNPRAAQPLVQVFNYSPNPIRFALGTALRNDDLFRIRLV